MVPCSETISRGTGLVSSDESFIEESFQLGAISWRKPALHNKPFRTRDRSSFERVRCLAVNPDRKEAGRQQPFLRSASLANRRRHLQGEQKRVSRAPEHLLQVQAFPPFSFPPPRIPPQLPPRKHWVYSRGEK